MKLALFAPPLLASLLIACGGGSDTPDSAVSESSARQALPGMVLQRVDVAADLANIGGEFSTNKEAAAGLGTGPTEEQLDAWGRVLGYRGDFQAQAAAAKSAIIAVTTSVSIYATAQGAADSIEDRIRQARAVDWQQSHSDLETFAQVELKRDVPADDMLWLRFTGFKETRPGNRVIVSDDQIVFRVGQVWGFVGAVSTAEKGQDDRNVLLPQIETLVRKQITHMRDALESGLLRAQ